MSAPSDLPTFELSELERSVLAHGSIQWTGPAHCTEELAVARGVTSVADLSGRCVRCSGPCATADP